MLKKVMDKNIKLYYVIVMLSVLKKNDVDFKVTRPSFLFGGGGGVGVPSYFEALWYPHLSFFHDTAFLFNTRAMTVLG